MPEEKLPEKKSAETKPSDAKDLTGSLRVELVHIAATRSIGGAASTPLPQLRRWLGELERLAGGTKRAPVLLRTLEPTPLGLRAAIDLPAEPLAELTTDLQRLRTDRQLDHLRPARGKQFADWQVRALAEAGFAVRLTLDSAQGASVPVTVDASTDWAYRQTFVAVELYLYGTITRMGGRLRPRVQIRDERLGTRTLDCPRQALADERTNRLYRRGGVHASARLNLASGQLDRWMFIGFVDLKSLSAKAEAKHLVAATVERGASTCRGLDHTWLRKRRG